MNKIWNLILLLFILIGNVSVSAQKIERFSNKEGFNQNTIKAIEKDSYGFLWFATPNGLIKYDGYDFISFTSESNANSISNNNISFLFNDPNDLLWIGSNNGLNIYIPGLEKFIELPIPSTFSINNIDSDSKGHIWVSTENKLYVYSPIDPENGAFEISNNVLDLYPDIGFINDFIFIDDNALLLATSKGIIRLTFEFDASNKILKINTITNFSTLENIRITSLKKIKDIFWIGTNSGLFKASLEGDRMHIIKKIERIDVHEQSSSPLVINTIYEGRNGSVWIGTKEQGLARYIPKTDSFENFTYDPKNKLGLSSPYIYSVFEDDYNVLWIGTAQGGINKLDLSQKQFINYTNNPYDSLSISDNLITSILEDNKGQLWVSSYNKSLFRSIAPVNDNNIQKLRFETIDDFPLPKQDIIRAIYQDQKGYIWFGTQFSLVVYNPLNKIFKKIRLEQYGEIVPDQVYFTINQTENDKIILGGNQLIVLENPWEQIDREKAPSIKVKSSIELGNNIAHTILKDSKENYWFGTVYGLLKAVLIEGEINITNEYYDYKQSQLRLSNSNIFSLYEDTIGNIWVGTFGGGLNKMSFDDQGNVIHIDHYRKKSVLPDDAVYGMLPEGNDLLWISTDMGLCKFNMKNSNVDVFDVRDGLINNNFRQSAFFKGKSGYYYFGGLNGLTIFKPGNIKSNSQVPKVLITNLNVDNENIQIGKAYKGKIILEKSISESESISINQNKQSISFNLLVNHSASPSKNKLAYKLEGFNDEWVQKDAGKTTVTYTNLSAGNYIFKAKGTNGDGLWSTETTYLKVAILPPWYREWWSITIFILLLLSIIAGILVYFIEHERLKHQLKYEEINKQRLDTLNQGKFRFFTNISHEFRTPLTLIAGPLDRIVEQNTNPKSEKYLDIVQRNTKRLLNLVDQLITFRQAEQGIINLNLSKSTLAKFMYPITEAFENHAIEKHINFFYKVNPSPEEVILDFEKIERVIFNLLSNSFKNTPPNGDISIEMDLINNDGKMEVSIEVIDNGKGIPVENLDNIFERFYQLGDNDNKVSGGGIGLAFCKSIIELQGGTITAKSKQLEETRFSVTIPCKTDDEYNMIKVSAFEKSFVKDWITPPVSDSERNLDEPSHVNQKAHTVLVVENEEDIQNFLMTSLSETYNVIIANNGVEGLEKTKLNKPSIVISDIMMPEMDGYELCEKIKSDIVICHIPVLLLTALGNNENLIKGLELGADEYISKPFSLRHLELCIHKLIQNNIKLKEYFAKNSLLPKNDIDISTRDIEFLNKVIEAIEKNISNSNFGVEELAGEMGLSKSHFYRRLKQLTGQVPNVYLRNFRLQRAAELLRKNDGARVLDVMYQIGIESTSYFSTSFKKLHGVSPSEF